MDGQLDINTKSFQRSPSGKYVLWYDNYTGVQHSREGKTFNLMMDIQRIPDQDYTIRAATIMAFEKAYELSGYVY